VENWRLCGTCDHLKFENEFLSKRCKILCAKSFESHDSCHSDVGVSKIASSQPELIFSADRESLDIGTSTCVLDSSSIAISKLASFGVAQSDSDGKGASHFFGAHISKPKFHCIFCKKDGHTVEFCFRRVNHERRVRAKGFRKPRSPSHDTCDSKLGTKLKADAFGSKSQETSHFKENGDSSSRTVPRDRPLYHCFFCEKDGHQLSFCYCRARRMRRDRASRPLVVHSPSHGMNICEPSKKPHFIDGFFDSFSSGLGHDHGHVSSACCVGPRHVSHGACVGSPLRPSGHRCLFASGSTRSSYRVAPLRRASLGVSSSSDSNQHLHHANPHDKLSTPFTHVAKSWVPKSMLANPLGSKARTCLSSGV